MKTCIWCNKSTPHISFNKKAHIVPQSMGGTEICENVCDSCNHFFGANHDGVPPIELVFKETFNITRARLLGKSNIGKNKALSRFKSVYFNVDFVKNRIDVKPSFKLQTGFQSILCHQFKRSIYKIFLEENERVNGNSRDDKYDFIREFARFNIGDYPVLYYQSKVPFLLSSKDEPQKPNFYFQKKFVYLDDEHGFFDTYYLGHVFGFPIIRNWELVFDNYISQSLKQKERFYKRPISIKYLTDIDLTLSFMNA
ncbi:HNH endonuclease [uncultured Draconibacterium sp.]|uniref:HNH endonuclease n=1 Tax=uncultured Draconibacterium sp. TaxID=1573823 RepID=UPI0025F2816B|nr:HNH endonuclease [uncultured Draconibacterium sp.]